MCFVRSIKKCVRPFFIENLVLNIFYKTTFSIIYETHKDICENWFRGRLNHPPPFSREKGERKLLLCYSQNITDIPCVVLGDSRDKSINSGIIDNFYIKSGNFTVTPLPKNFVFVIFSENDTIFKKIVIWRTIRNLISHKKGYIHFCHQTPLPFKRDLAHRNSFSPFSPKIHYFLEKILNNKIFST